MKIAQTMTALLILSTLSFSQISKAEDVALPVIKAPAALSEGTQRDLTAAQIAELLPWAKNSKIFLNDLIESVQGLTSQDKVDRLVDGIKNVLPDSSPKSSELLMRYCLTRALVLNDTLKREMASDAVGAVDVQVRVLVNSIKLAMNYYDSDIALLTSNQKVPFIDFGMKYFTFLSDLNKSIFDASAQYAIQRTSFEWLQWDLYRDLNNTSFAPQIVKINNSLKIFPTTKVSDSQAINYIRQMKQLSSQLNLQQTINSLRDAAIQAQQSEKVAFSSRLEKNNVLKSGDKIYYQAKDSMGFEAEIVSIQEDGQYIIKNEDGKLFSNVSRSIIAPQWGCSDNKVCVDDNLITIKFDNVMVRVVGITLEQKYVVEFLEGTYRGQTAFGWDMSNFAVTKGCSSEGLCINDAVINTNKNEYAKIVGIQADNKYVITFTSGLLDDKTAANWDKKYLVKQ